MLSRLLFLCALSTALLRGQNLPPIHSWAEADNLEAQLDSHPEDASAHLDLLRYYNQQIAESAARVHPLRRKQILWLIEHQPEFWSLGDLGRISPAADPDGFEACGAAWQKALEAPNPPSVIFANAAMFYRTADLPRARRIAEEGLERYPDSVYLSEVKGIMMAYTIVGVKALDWQGRPTLVTVQPAKSEEAERDRQALEASGNRNLLTGAARTLTDLISTRNLSMSLADLEALIVRLYRRVIEMNPDNDSKNALGAAYREFSNVAATPAEKVTLLETGLRAVPRVVGRSRLLTELAQQYVSAGDLEKAAEAATELLNVDRSDADYSYMAFTGNTVLGRVALQKGDMKEAAERLLAAGRAHAIPAFGIAGANDWRLAEGVLAAGDRQSVLAYLDLLRGFWKNDNGRLDAWASTIRDGGTPGFTPKPGGSVAQAGPAVPAGVAGSTGFDKNRYVGRPASEFRLKDLKGNEVSLAEFKGKVVLVDFWATWCGPCRQEMPEFQKIHRQMASKDVVVLALDVNEPRETAAEYVAKEKFTFPVLLANGTDVMDRYGVRAYPTTFGIDKNGLVADVLIGSGPGNAARLDGLIEKARAGAPPPAASFTPPAPVAPARVLTPPTASTTAEDFYRDATRQHTAKDYAAAIQSLDRALALRPDWLLAVVARADNHYHAKQYDEAIAGFSHAIELDPKRAASYDSRALAYSYSGRHAQAIPDYTRAIELAPAATPYNNRGWAYMETGHLDDALADLNQALDLNPSYTTALFNRAHLFERRKELAKAIADYNSVLHLEPGNAQATTQKSAALRRMGDSGATAPASLAAPKPLSPADGAVLEHFPRDTTVVWSEVPGAASYVVEWDFKDDQGWFRDRKGIVASIPAAQPVVTFQFVGAQPGRWRVWALDAGGAAGPKSEWREFRYTK